MDEQQRLLGIVTQFDLFKALCFDTQTFIFYDDKEIVEQAAAAVIIRNPVGGGPTLPLPSRLLYRPIALRGKSLPVTESGPLVGMIADG